MATTHVIIGASAAGIATAHKIRQIDSGARIIVISQEHELPYNKCLLADYVAGAKSYDDVVICDTQLAAEKNIELLLGVAVCAIETASKTVLLDNGTSYHFDTLCIATGTRPYMPPIQGTQANGIFAFHSMLDVQELLQQIEHERVQNVVVVGAGLSGLECADALNSKGAQVVVVERADQVLSRQITPSGARLMREKMHQAGVVLYANKTVKQVLEHQGRVVGVELVSGEQLKADMVVFAAGVVPNTNFLPTHSFNLQQGRIIVDATMQTSVPHIYAAGDCTLVNDLLTGTLVPSCTWPDAMQQGMVAGSNMAGQHKEYHGAVVVTSSAFFGIKFATCGPVREPLSEHEVLALSGFDTEKLFLLDTNNRLCGFMVVAPSLHLGTYRRLILTKHVVDKSELIASNL